MNSNWRNRPTKIEAIPKEIDYIISIDENGTANLKKVLEAKRKGMEVPDIVYTLRRITMGWRIYLQGTMSATFVFHYHSSCTLTAGNLNISVCVGIPTYQVPTVGTVPGALAPVLLHR